MDAGQNGIVNSGSTPFRARARLIRLLGEELISDEVMAVVELVKNGYDADACEVTVTLSQVMDAELGEIRIRDDGTGMDLDRVLYSWMEPATHQKRPKRGTRKVRTTRGRVQLGEKGVGRFAADKLGSELELISRQADSAEEVVLKVAWHRFDQEQYLDEVENNWFTREPVTFARDTYGTLVVIRSLRTTWTGQNIRNLHNGLMRLVAPTALSTEFRIVFECDEAPELYGPVRNELVESAPYRVSGMVDARGILTRHDTGGEAVDLRMLSQSHFVTGGGELREPVCGPFRIALNVWDLEPRALNGLGFGVDREMRQWIKGACGVSVYRDGFRVWPYGEPDDDWLELNQRRVNNPTLRVSNNQVIGSVEITHRDNQELRDRTSREGLIDNPALFDLKALVLAALSVVETQRFGIRREILLARDAERQELGDAILYELGRVRAALNGTGGQGRAALVEIERLYREQKEQTDRRYNHVSRLAGIGMAAELLTDGFSRSNLQTMTILRALQGEVQVTGSPVLTKLVEELAVQMEDVSEQLDLMGPLYRPDPEEREALSVAGAVYDTALLLESVLSENGTRVRLSGDRPLTVRLSRGHLMQVLMILMQNAHIAMAEAGTVAPEIEVRLQMQIDHAGLLVCDNGPGVAENVRGLIFEPYYSTRRAGRGLGLHVAREILAAYNSHLTLLDEEKPLSGACFQVRFDRRRVVS